MGFYFLDQFIQHSVLSILQLPNIAARGIIKFDIKHAIDIYCKLKNLHLMGGGTIQDPNILSWIFSFLSLDIFRIS